jgi:hypothetical protein
MYIHTYVHMYVCVQFWSFYGTIGLRAIQTDNYQLCRSSINGCVTEILSDIWCLPGFKILEYLNFKILKAFSNLMKACRNMQPLKTVEFQSSQPLLYQKVINKIVVKIFCLVWTEMCRHLGMTAPMERSEIWPCHNRLSFYFILIFSSVIG